MAKNERGILPNNMAKQGSPGNGTLSNDPGHGIGQLKEASSQIIWPGKIFWQRHMLSNDQGHGMAKMKEASSQIIQPDKAHLAMAHALE